MRVKAAPRRRSNSMRADTAFAWASSRRMGCWDAWMTCLFNQKIPRNCIETTYALSMLLKRARKTCRFGLILSAMSRTSVPICSPSRSQSVHMNRMEAYLAWVSMFFATIFLSWSMLMVDFRILLMTYVCNGRQDRSIEQRCRLTRVPFSESFVEVLSDDVTSHASKCHLTLSPLLKAEVELVVLDPRDARDIFLLWSARRRLEYEQRDLIQPSLDLRDGLRLLSQWKASPPRIALASCLSEDVRAMQYGTNALAARMQPGHVKTRWTAKSALVDQQNLMQLSLQRARAISPKRLGGMANRKPQPQLMRSSLLYTQPSTPQNRHRPSARPQEVLNIAASCQLRSHITPQQQ